MRVSKYSEKLLFAVTVPSFDESTSVLMHNIPPASETTVIFRLYSVGIKAERRPPFFRYSEKSSSSFP